ncbi:MAG: DciA family protein [Solirubrobacterales bacterium]|nr:DciA family protein [Solirubrobacterales bacterium]
MTRRRVPRPLAAAVGIALERAEPATLLAAVQSAWPGAVGEAIAREATPISERDGIVKVACRSATWAEELDLLGERILGQVRRDLPDAEALESLRFLVSEDLD